MRIASSLSNRIFLACTLLATLSLGFAFSFVNRRAAVEAEAELRRGLTDAAALVDQHRLTLTSTLTRMARLVADLPRLKAAVETADPPTVQQLADEYLRQVNADLFVVTGANGRVLASAGVDEETLARMPLAGEGETSAFVPHARGVLQVVSVPIFLLGSAPETLGRLTVGFFLDDALATQFRSVTGSEIAFGADGRILAASIPAQDRAAIARVLAAPGITRVDLETGEFLALSRPIVPAVDSDAAPSHPVVVTLRSRTERLRFLNTVRTGLAGALLLTVVLATILSYGVARTMTRPLAAITGAMRDVAATGDLTRKVTLHSGAWDDEDARLLASAFNTLTDSIGRFQREASQRDRLSSLGRLSTVIAHEIRNPLMIITAALSTLRRDSLTREEMRDAVSDIDDETARLNRIVTEVLDFAKPIRFELAEANVNDICRDSVSAAWAGAPHDDVVLELEEGLPPVVTDSERLRTALVNILMNARHAMAADRSDAARTPARHAGASVIVTTRRAGDRVAIAVHDNGTGIAADDMAHIFDPYFTTRRAGTGLGLPISKNIVEGLGGSIRVRSARHAGTEITLDLPLSASGATA